MTDPPEAAPAPEAEPAPEAVPDRKSGRYRGVRVGVVAVLALLVPLGLRVAIEGSHELAQADRARAEQALDREIEHLGRALRWRAPLLSHDEEALERLWAIAQQQQARGVPGRAAALAAYREVRRGLLATRVLDVPHRPRWEDANEHIAALMAEQERELEIGRPGLPEARAHHRSQLDHIPGPDPLRGSLATLAFLGWIGAVVGFAVRGLDGEGRLVPRPALRWGLLAIIALVAWTTLLYAAHMGP